MLNLYRRHQPPCPYVQRHHLDHDNTDRPLDGFQFLFRQWSRHACPLLRLRYMRSVGRFKRKEQGICAVIVAFNGLCATMPWLVEPAQRRWGFSTLQGKRKALDLAIGVTNRSGKAPARVSHQTLVPSTKLNSWIPSASGCGQRDLVLELIVPARQREFLNRQIEIVRARSTSSTGLLAYYQQMLRNATDVK
jgi:hypothetical protein